MTFNQIEFIEKLLLPDLEKMVKEQLHYYAFAIICQGIEVMGASADQYGLGDRGMSEARFRNGISTYFKDIRYRNNQTKLYEFLRGPLVHQLRPGETFWLACAAKDGIDPGRHLDVHATGATILIIEPFLTDFRGAFATFKKSVEANKVAAPERFTNPFITVASIAQSYGQTQWDPTISKMFTLTPSATGQAFPT
jgi:hypothetical protein